MATSTRKKHRELTFEDLVGLRAEGYIREAVKVAAKLWDKGSSNNTGDGANPFSAKAKILEKQETEGQDIAENWRRTKEFVIRKISNSTERRTKKAPVRKARVRKPNP